MLEDRLVMFHTILRCYHMRYLSFTLLLDRCYQIPFSRIDTHKFSFFPASVRLWNSFPNSIVHFDSLELFRRSVTAFLNRLKIIEFIYTLLVIYLIYFTYLLLLVVLIYCTHTLLESYNYYNNYENKPFFDH